jgi:Fe-S oxidoreductase
MASPSVALRCLGPALEIAQAVTEAGGEELRNCYQCGTCTAVCPWGNLKAFSPRTFVEMARLGLEGFEEDAWTCVNCKTCWDRCPQQINIPLIFQSVRSILREWNAQPSTMNAPLGSLRSEGNPWGEKKSARETWARSAEVQGITPATEHLLFTCCTNDYEARSRRDARAVVDVLRSAAVDFGYLGNAQRCCGDLALTVGDGAVFEKLQGANVEQVEKAGVASLLAVSPHCLHSFKNRYVYPGGEAPAVRHVTEIYAEHLAKGSLRPTRTIERRVTYHDPCYLGRYNDIYDAPRDVLRALPGLELVEMPHHRETSLCCGGGGGGIWIDTPKGKRLSDIRVLEALGVEATVIAAACPYCVQMLESSIVSMDLEDKLRVMTVSELLAEALSEAEA